MKPDLTALHRLTRVEAAFLRIKYWTLNAFVFILDCLVAWCEAKPTPEPARRYNKRHRNLRLVPKSEADKECEPHWSRRSTAKLRLIK